MSRIDSLQNLNTDSRMSRDVADSVKLSRPEIRSTTASMQVRTTDSTILNTVLPS